MFFFFNETAITEECDKMLGQGELAPIDQIEREYALFRKRFGPEVLRNLDGEDLIESIFNVMNHDGLAYWLEFKQDDLFNTKHYGSIAGGSSLKYIMYKRKVDHSWMTGSSQNQEILSLDAAIEKGCIIRDMLIQGAEFISGHQELQPDDYMKLQQLLDSGEIRIGSYGWIHKYYHMLFPNLIDPFHTIGWQKHALICCGEKPASESAYVLSGQLMAFIKRVERPSCHVMKAIARLYGPPVNYYRIGTKNATGQKTYWADMRDNSYISIGWPYLGDLTHYGIEDSEFRNALKSAFEHYYPNRPQTVSREINEITKFVKTLKENDIVVTGDGMNILGIGRVTGGYEYREGLDFPHVREVEWLHVGENQLPEAKEGLRTTVFSYKSTDNLLKIRELLSSGTAGSKQKADHKPIKKPLIPLQGVMKKIEQVLERKKQIILYGPPGTGKTYHAEKTVQELAARGTFHKSWKELNQEEMNEIKGNGRESGQIRACCFHASYGYEDFIEGIKPRIEKGHTQFELRDGIFKRLCVDAVKAPNKPFYLLIDEINRGDISRIFGELIMLIETGKRGKSLLLPTSGELFFVPENVYIVGTMNTADRSIALLDAALRRRFGFYELMPNYDLLEGIHFDGLPLAEWLKQLNMRICQHIGKDARNLQIGHSYFMENDKPISSPSRFGRILEEDILPLIEEYCYGDYDRMLAILDSDLVDVKNQILRYSLLEEFSELMGALLKPCPEIRLSIEPKDNTDIELNGDVEEEEP